MSIPLQHGGALDQAIARYGGRRDEWLDLSTGINPEGIPIPDIISDHWRRLPEQDFANRMLEKARAFYGVPDGAMIVAAPGTQSLIQILPEIIGSPNRVEIAGPTYGEYGASFARAGWEVAETCHPEAISNATKAAVIVNPNNPDGRIAGLDTIAALSQKLAEKGGLAIVDEAFQESSEAQSAAGLVPGGGIVVLKSFGKFFGLAGLRLGFAIARPDIAARISNRLGPWAVSGPALGIADWAFSDIWAIAALRERISLSTAMLEDTLDWAGLETVGSTQLFRLVRHERAAGLHGALCRRHVLVRRFDYQPDWLRFGLARRADYPRLQAALACAIAEMAD